MFLYYDIFKSIHLICACFIIGYLAYDIFVFSKLKNSIKNEEFTVLKRMLLKNSVKFLAPSFLILLLSGAFLGYFHSENFFSLENSMQKLILIKIVLLFSLILCVSISLSCIFLFKKQDPFKQFYHHIALLICILALILAKFAYFL